MQASQIPAKFTIPWANSAGSTYINTIPTASQIGIHNGYASLTDGFVPLNSTPVASGGVPPRIQDWNGILNEVTAWLRWAQSGAPVAYDGTFQAAIGGYPDGAMVQSVATPGTFWLSTADNNTTDPDTGGAGWVRPFAALAGSSSQVFNVANATTATEAVALGQWTKGGSTSIVYPSATAAGGTVGSSGWSKDPSGLIKQWAYIQLEDSTNITWTFPITFASAPLKARGQNVGIANGQTTTAQWAGIVDVSVTPSTTAAGFTLHNTGTAGTLDTCLVEVEGY